MATDKQIAANRANAAKSTGPKTPRGKAVSARNRALHGLLSRSYILTSECPARFETFVAGFYDEYQPATPTEAAFVQTMATARWRLIRMSNLEAASIDYEYASEPDPAAGLAPLTTPARTTLAYRRASEAGRSIELMNRAEARLQQQFNSAFDRLQRLRHRLEFPPSPTDPIS